MENGSGRDEDKNNKTPFPVTVFYKPKPNIVHEILSDDSDSESDHEIHDNSSSVGKVGAKTRRIKRMHDEESTDNEYQLSDEHSSDSDYCLNSYIPKRPKQKTKKTNTGEKRDSQTGESGEIHIRGTKKNKGIHIVSSDSQTGESGDIHPRGSKDNEGTQIVSSDSQTGERGDIHPRESQNNESFQTDNNDSINKRTSISYKALLDSSSINFRHQIDSSSSDSDQEKPYRKKRPEKVLGMKMNGLKIKRRF